ncbi:MAG: hypothetical protein Q4C66_11150 [Lachnospiraceae bacterium]|nr:hypothetical protein [Lachnospiraceae bacterium]
MIIRETRIKKIGLLAAAGAAICLNCHPAFAADGWKQEDGKSYYIQNEQRLTGQWFSLEREVHYQQKLPSDLVKEDEIVTDWYYAGSDGAVYKNGWYEIDGNFYYFNGGGVNVRKNWVTIGDDRYYADEQGIRKQDGWFSITNVNAKGVEYTNWYYAKSDGVLYRNGWYNIDGNQYYFDGSGNSPRKNWVNVGTDRYYVDEKGIQQTGWFAITGEDAQGVKYEKWYLAGNNGVLVRGCWFQLENDWYFFDANGFNYRKRWYVDPDTKQRYYLKEDGVLEDDGWFAITGENSQGVKYENWYYAKPDGNVYTDCYETIDGKRYGFDANGLMYKNRWITKNDNRSLYADENGVITTQGWFNVVTKDEEGNDVDNWYYADASGYVHRSEKSKWSTINGERYYLSRSGRITTGWVDDKIAFCGDNGAALKGWQYLEIPEDWISDDDYISDYVSDHGDKAYFYFHPNTGKKKYATSGRYKVMEIDKKEYCFDNYGIMQTGWVKYSSKNPAVSGYRYFETVDDAEEQAGNSVLSQWRYLKDPEELDGSGESGWYYFGSNGYAYAAPAGKEFGIRKINGKNYLFDEFGKARRGLVELDGEFYYFGKGTNGLEGASGRITIEDGVDSNVVYYFDSNSKGVTGIQNGYFYYKGRLQTAEKDVKYQVFDIPNVGKRLVNSSGKVMKGTKVKDGMDQEWVVSGSGEITTFGDNGVAGVVEPEELIVD